MTRSTSKSLFVFGAASVMLAGCASVTDRFRDADTRWADYKSWEKVSETPSTGPSPGLGAVHKGPEGFRFVYVNAVGREVIKGEGPYDYPEGTVIVKEQYDDQAAFEAGGQPDVTVSLKVADVAGGGKDNWHWADSYKSTAGESAFCSGCHSVPLATDFVFSNATYLAENER